MRAPLPWGTAWRIARRGLDWRFRGLRLLFVCLVLGAGALAVIGTLTGAIERELANRGQAMLGGDAEFTLAAHPAGAPELAAMARIGMVSAGVRMQAMARRPGGDDTAVPVELKAVDARWPLYGTFRIAGRAAPAGAPQGNTAWIAPGVADRLGVGPGDHLRIGQADLVIGGVIADEPDRLGEGFQLGPTVIIGTAALDRTGLVSTGSLARWKYRLRLPPGGNPDAAVAAMRRAFPAAGFDVRTRDRASPGLDRFVGRLGQFLGLVALAAQAIAGAQGLLIATTFAALPLINARRFPAMALLRARIAPLPLPWRAAALPVGGGLAGIVALAVLPASQPLLALGFLGGAAALFAVLALLGRGVTALAARLPRPRGPIARLALGNLHRPGAQVPALVVALGFALAAFVMLAAIETSLDANIARRVPARAPDYFALDVPRGDEARFRAVVEAAAPGAVVRTVPAMRGTILAYGPPSHMTRVADLRVIPEGAWALRGDRGLTYADAVPPGNVITAGRWWTRDHRGGPEVSIDEALARLLDLHLGDRLTISLMGVERSATITSFRRIDWDSFGFNYVLVFSPDAISDAPHNLAATIELPPARRTPEVRRRILSSLVRALPSSSVIEVGPVLTEARRLLEQVGAAVLAAASVAVLAGMAVLAGAIAAQRAERSYDTVILRVLGAGSGQLLGLICAEYGLLSLVLGTVALALGTGVAWGVIVWLFEFAWLPDWRWIGAVLLAGLGLVMALALGGSWAVLRARPAKVLREL